MTFQAKTPEDVLPDGLDFTYINGIKARKGSIAAAMANAEIIGSPQATEQEKAAAIIAFKELIPTLKALRLGQFLIWKNPQCQQMMDEV